MYGLPSLKKRMTRKSIDTTRPPRRSTRLQTPRQHTSPKSLYTQSSSSSLRRTTWKEASGSADSQQASIIENIETDASEFHTPQPIRKTRHSTLGFSLFSTNRPNFESRKSLNTLDKVSLPGVPAQSQTPPKAKFKKRTRPSSSIVRTPYLMRMKRRRPAKGVGTTSNSKNVKQIDEDSPNVLVRPDRAPLRCRSSVEPKLLWYSTGTNSIHTHITDCVPPGTPTDSSLPTFVNFSTSTPAEYTGSIPTGTLHSMTSGRPPPVPVFHADRATTMSCISTVDSSRCKRTRRLSCLLSNYTGSPPVENQNTPHPALEASVSTSRAKRRKKVKAKIESQRKRRPSTKN